MTAIVLLALGGCGRLCAGFVHDKRLDAAGWQSRQNIYTIQLAAERYAADKGGEYPRNPEELIRQGYLSEFPQNPYSGLLRGAQSLEQPRPMRPLQPGEYCPGDFVYLPIARASGFGREVVSCVLVVCGYYADEDIIRSPVSPNTSGLYNEKEAQDITAAYYRPGAWR